MVNGATHALLVYFKNNKIYWFENAWKEYAGIHAFNTIEDLMDFISPRFVATAPKGTTNCVWHKNFKGHGGMTIEDVCLENISKKSLEESTFFNTKDIIDTSKFKQIEKLISGSYKILIVRHISPDADAIYSSKALYQAIKEKYPKKEVILGNESTKERLTKDDLLIILDLGVKTRIAAEVIGSPKTVRIDHHPDTLQADISLVIPTAGSTSELITLFLSEMKYEITKQMAENLFRGIISDTGRLQYNLSQTALAATSILTDIGVDYEKIYNQMYVKDDEFLKAKTYILNNYKRTPNGVAYLFIDKERMKNAAVNSQKIIDQIYELSGIKDCPIWVILRENAHKEITMSIRSRTIPIDDIAKIFGGGGHKNAAGIKVDNRETAKNVLTKLDSYIAIMKRKNPNLF